MIDRTLKVLLLEDLPTDQILVKRQVLKFAPNTLFSTANSRESFEEQINWTHFDVILSDYKLPAYTGLDALQFVRKHQAHVPFIFITGTMNDEERAAKSILSGASGYLLKSNLKTLPKVMEEVLEKSREIFEAEEARRQEQARKERLTQKLIAKIKMLPENAERAELLDIAEELAGENIELQTLA
ncbi:MAG: response regulator [Bacteroidota bacterium]